MMIKIIKTCYSVYNILFYWFCQYAFFLFIFILLKICDIIN